LVSVIYEINATGFLARIADAHRFSSIAAPQQQITSSSRWIARDGQSRLKAVIASNTLSVERVDFIPKGFVPDGLDQHFPSQGLGSKYA
jgi:hypothetical protein